MTLQELISTRDQYDSYDGWVESLQELTAKLEQENTRLRDSLGALVHDIQSFAVCEHGDVNLAQHYAPSLPNALSVLPNV